MSRFVVRDGGELDTGRPCQEKETRMETKIQGKKVWLCIGEVPKGARKKSGARKSKARPRTAAELKRLRLENLTKARRKKERLKKQRLRNLKKARAAAKAARARR